MRKQGYDRKTGIYHPMPLQKGFKRVPCSNPKCKLIVRIHESRKENSILCVVCQNTK